ncbi:MAG: hypothetical protein ACYDDO_07575 [Acidiferrobacterales bacterium]
MTATRTKKKRTKSRARKRVRTEVPSRVHAKPASLIGQLGWLRLLLAIVAIIAIVATPKAGTLAVYAGWQMVPTLIVPVLAPLIFVLLLMDSLMSRIWMTDKEPQERKHFKLAIALNLLLALGMAVSWFPYFHAIASQ